MTILEIILLVYIILSQIVGAALITSKWNRTHEILFTVLLFVLFPIVMLTVMTISSIDSALRKRKIKAEAEVKE